MKYIKFVWAFPVTLIGCLLLALSCGWTRRDKIADRLVWGFTPRFSWWLPKRFSAITMGNIIITRELLKGDLLTHELEHVRQCEILGAFAIVLYPLLSFLAWLLYEKLYQGNYFEMMARLKAKKSL